MTAFFLERPVFAWVLAITISLSGLISLSLLPVSQYPSIAPPAIQITANYPGADAKTVEETVSQVVERQMSGLDNMLYTSSSSDAQGNAVITVTFDTGTDPDIAQVQVQNKLQLAMPFLPQEVQGLGISVQKVSSGFFMVVGVTSNGERSLSQTDLADYVSSSMIEEISRINGVGQVQLFGSPYSMRIWLDPDKINSYNLSTEEVVQAIKSQNHQVAGGQLGGEPASANHKISTSIIAQTRLNSPEQFENIILRSGYNSGLVRLKDIARVEIGSENYNTAVRYNGKPAAGFGIKLAPGANALDTARDVKNTLAMMEPSLPYGTNIVYPYDTTPFISISIKNVIKTLIEAIILVTIVMYIFLQNIRATLIPAIAVPVVLLGTFSILAIFGYSVNTLTMFAMVLAIGLLVDDAIIVVENVERIMAEEGLSPKDATKKSVHQIRGAIFGVTLVLTAVFVPMAFFKGSSGIIYRQFSVTIISAMVLSAFTALTLTPVLCSTMLRQTVHGRAGGLFKYINTVFHFSSEHYQRSVGSLLKKSGRMMLLYTFILIGVAGMFVILPGSFLPDEDQGVFMNMVQLPSGATQNRTQKTLDLLTDYYLKNEAHNVDSVFTVAGFGLNGNGQQNGIAFVSLKDWSERRKKKNHVDEIIQRANKNFKNTVTDGMALAFNLPAIPELGSAKGFDFQLIDNESNGHQSLIKARNQMLFMAQKFPDFVTKVRPNGMEDATQLKIIIDHEKAEASGVSNESITNTLSTLLGGVYINDFNDRGRSKKVYMQADNKFRMNSSDMDKIFVKATDGKMVPLSSIIEMVWISGASKIEHFNGKPSIELLGEPAPSRSSGTAMKVMEKLFQKLPTGYDYRWVGISYQQKLTSNQSVALYTFSLLIIFFCLAALYESWSLPLSVMLVVPVGALGALLMALITGQTNDIYFQVGLLTTIGISTKNAIMIVEFSRNLIEEKNISATDAIMKATRLRYRPILMTSLAFILGVLPLVLSNGAGSGAQNAIGTSVMGGVIAATVFAIYFVPVFYIFVMSSFCSKSLVKH